MRDVPARSAEEVSRIDTNGVLLPALEDLVIESWCRNRRKVGDSTLHVVSMPIGGKVVSLLIGRFESDPA